MNGAGREAGPDRVTGDDGAPALRFLSRLVPPVRAHRFAFVFLALIALVPFLAPLLRGEVFTLRDHFDYFQPLRWFTTQELLAGRLPLWNPYNASGEPWLANPQTAVFYPPTLLFLVLPFAAAYMLHLALHLVILGWGAYLYFSRKASRGAALVGATALMFSGPVLSLLDVSNNLATFSWIPLALWCAAERAWRRGAVVLALGFLGGEPFFAAIGALLYAIVALRRSDDAGDVTSGATADAAGRRARPWRRGLMAIAGTGVLAFGLTAVQLFPFLALVWQSDRAAGLEASLVLHHSMPLRDWLRVVVPPQLGEGGYDPMLGQQFIPAIYVGIVVAVLALLGLGRRTAGWLVLLGAVAFVASGPEMLAKMPVTLFRYPARLLPLAALAIAALAVAGWDRFRADRRWLDLLVVLLVLVDLVPRMWPLLRAAPFRRDVVRYAGEVGARTKILRVGPVDPNQRAAWISGYLNLYERRFDAFTAAPVVSNAYVQIHRGLQETPTRAGLAQKAIGWVLTTHDLGPAFREVARAGNVVLYRNPATLPVASLVMRSPLTMKPLEVLFDSRHARVTVDAPKEGVVLLMQQHAPGWSVTVDGVEAGGIVVQDVFRGVQVTRGVHEIVWRYHPRPLYHGLVISLLSVIALTVSSFVKHTR